MNVHRPLTFLLLAVLGPQVAVAADAPPAAAVVGATGEAVPAAAEAAPAALAAPLRYRRVYVPQTEITNFVRGGYWPIRREQFNQLVDSIREQASSLLADGVWMESAEYTAVCADGQLTSGVARWRVTHAASRAAALTLTPCTLALGAAFWRDGESEVPAIVGTDGSGELVVHVEKSGELMVPWTARGQTNAWGETSFDLVLAPSPVNRLSLDVAEGMAVGADCGVVTAMPAESSGDAIPRGMRRWAVELGGARRLRLTVSPSRGQQQRQLAASVQQELLYRLLPDGLEAVCGVTLSIDREPLESLTFEVDAELQVTGVQLDGRDAAWTMAEGTAGGPRELRLQFDEPLTAGEFQVELTAIGPLKTEVLWRLPACRVKHVFWRQGTLGLTVPESVQLQQLIAHDARPVRVDRLPDGEEGELRRFQLFAAHGGVDVVLARRQPEITAALGTTVDVERGLMTARVAMDLQCAHGECFALEADVPAAWMIEGIDCESTGPIDDYEIVAIDATHKRLRIPLAAALTPERPMHLVLTAHRSPSYTLLATHVRPLRLRNAAESSRLVAVNVEAGYRFNLEGDADLVRLDHANLAAADARRLRPRAGGIVFVDNQRAASLAINVVREEPAYAATCFADVAWDGAAVAEQYRIVCRPESAPVDRVLIHLSQLRPDDMQWSLTGSRGGLSGVRKLTARQQQRAKLDAAGETWELTLGAASGEPFEIHGARRTTMAMPCSLALPMLPAADAQEGWLTVRSLDGSELSLRADAAKPILVEPTARGTYSTSRARYRFNPSGNAQVVMDVPRKGTPQRPLWAWHCLLASQLLNTGQVVHSGTYLLESVGGRNVRFRLPAECVLRHVEVDGREVPHLTDLGVRCYGVALPDEQRYVCLRITYLVSGQKFALIGDVAARFPEVDFPVLDAHWTVWLPPGIQPSSMHGKVWPREPRVPSRTDRLLGPLAAPESHRPFDFFSREHWGELAGGAPGGRSSAAPALDFLRTLGSQVLDVPAGSTGGVSWRELLEGYVARGEASPGLSPASVWVDVASLAEEGFSLNDAVTPVDETNPADAAATVLADARLVVVACGESLLLTSVQGFARHVASLKMTDNRVVAVASSDYRLSAETLAGEHGSDAAVVPLAAWITRPEAAGSPWRAAREIAWAGPMHHLWRACEVRVGPGTDCRLAVYRPAALQALGWAALLATAGALCWLATTRPGVLVAAVPLSAVLALVVPALWVPVAAGLFVGTLLGTLLVLVRRRAHSRARGGIATAGNAQQVPSGVAVGTVLLVGLIAGSSTLDGAEEPVPPGGTEPSGPVYKLIVPVDEAMAPVGGYDYLPLPLYDALHQRANAGRGMRCDWLVLSAGYRAVLDWRQQRSALDIATFSAVYRLHLFQPEQRVEFPWPAKAETVEVLEARLANQPVELTWNAEATGFSLTVPTEGAVELELVLRPVTREEAGQRILQFAIPQIAASRLRVQVPSDAAAIGIASPLGEVRADAASGEQIAELGPTDSIRLTWPASVASDAVSRRVDVRQLMWLFVRPEQPHPVTLDTRLVCRAVTGRIHELHLVADPQLRLQPLTGAQLKQVAEPIVQGEDEQHVRIPLREPVDKEFTFDLQFQLDGSTGLGNIRLPRLSVVGDRVEHRWLAVSVAPELDFTPETLASLGPLEASDFLNAWGSADMAPNVCYRLLDDAPMWSIATRARLPRTEVGQEVDVSVGFEFIEWALRAELDTRNGSVFSHRVSVPKSFVVTSVAVAAEDGPVSAHAAHDGSGILTVILDRGVTAKHRLEIMGRQAIGGVAADVLLHPVTVLDAAIRSRTVRVYRQGEVCVDVESKANLPPMQGVEKGTFREPFGRLVAAYDLTEVDDANTAGARLGVQANRPVVKARQVTTLRRADDTWEAIVELDADLSESDARSVLDKFRFEVPPEWVEPFTLEPSMPYEVRDVPGQRRHLVVRPTQPVSDRFRVRMRGGLALREDERVRMPDVMPLDVTSAERFVVLPTQLDRQRIDWETSGLQPVALRDVLPDGATDTAWTAFRVWSKPRAVISDVQRVAGVRQIRLADVQVACQADGRTQGLVVFDIEPAGADGCTLDVPPGLELIGATVEGVPAMWQSAAEGKRHIQLASQQLPQRLTVLFRGNQMRPLVNSTSVLRVPWVNDFEVVRTLWTVRGPAGSVLRSEQANRHGVGPLRQELLRLHHTASLIESTADTVLESPPQEVRDWYTPWAIRLAAADARIARDRWLPNPDTSAADWTAIQALRERQTSIAQRLKVTSVLDQVRTEPSVAPQPADLWALVPPAGCRILRFAFLGKVPALSVACEVPRESRGRPDFAAAAVVVLCGGLFWGFLRRTHLTTWLRQWPYAAGVLAGLAWWMWANPSALGWLIVMGSLWGSLRFPLRSQAARDSKPNSPGERPR